METGTAALLQPYLDHHGDAGTPNYDQPTLDRLVAELDRDGFQIHVHAIGDRAIRMTLDAFEKARARNGARDSRHSIAHLELIDPADIPGSGTWVSVANFEALWADGDEYHSSHRAGAGTGTLAMAVPDCERGAHRCGAVRRQRLVGLIAQSPRCDRMGITISTPSARGCECGILPSASTWQR